MKKILILLSCLVILVIAAAAAASWWVMGQMGPEVWVRQAEQHWNCRAQIDEASLDLLSSPATLVFKGVQLARRDGEVELPLEERTPLEATKSDIFIAELRLTVRLEDLLKKRVHIEELTLLDPVIRETQTEQGSTLQALFRKPPKTAPEQDSTVPLPATPPEVEEKTKSGTEGDFTFALNAARVVRGSFFMNAKDTQVRITGLDYEIGGLDMETLKPGDELDTKLRALISVTGMTRVQGVRREAEMARIQLRGEGKITPIHPRTGEWTPIAVMTLTLAKGSQLGGQKTLGDAAGKDLRKLEDFGINLAPLPIGGPLQEDARIQGRWFNGAFGLTHACVFIFPEYEVALAPKSWVDTMNNTHEMDVRLSCGPQLQQQLQGGIASAKLGKDFARGLIAALSDDKGRLTFDIKSRGSLSDPKITPDTDRALKNLMSGRGLGDLLKGFLK